MKLNSLKLAIELFVGALLIAPAMAQACPKLSGDYTCTAFGGVFTLEVAVTQSTNRGVTTYVVDGAPLIADGKPHTAKVLPQILAKYVNDVRYLASCEGANVKFAGKGKLVKFGEVGTIEGFLTKESASQLHINMMLSSASGTKNVSAECSKN